jgi:Holliday junction resolvasome RuvABC endonuclease subunit
MLKKTTNILGVNPGSKYLGIAVFQGLNLKDARIKAFKGKWSAEKLAKMQRTVISLVNFYSPDVLAIKRLHPARSSKNLNGLAVKIRKTCQKMGLEIYEYSLEDLEEFFSPEEKISKQEMAEIIAVQYPDLYLELEREKITRNMYHLRMFEAVALASFCAHQLDKS